jgi:signal transduction histidine kinase
MSLRLRLILTYCGCIALLMLVFGGILYTTMQHSLQAEMDRRLRVRASEVELTIWPGSTTLTPQAISAANLNLAPLDELNAPGLYVQILDAGGNVVAASSTVLTGALLAPAAGVDAALHGDVWLGTAGPGGGRSLRLLMQPIRSGSTAIGVLEVGQSRQPLLQTLTDLRTLLLVVGSVALAGGALACWLITQRGLRRLTMVSAAAAEIAAQRDFTRRLPAGDYRDEVGQLSRTINDLLATVDQLLRRHREFLADTSHELRNPLLAVRTDLDLLNRIDDPEARQDCLDEARQQVERMSRLVADLLLLARTESGQVIEQRPVDLAALLRRVTADASGYAAERTVTLGALTQTTVQGDEGRLYQVLTNLVQNAAQHTGRGGRIALSLAHESGWAAITVADDGEGILPEHLPRIFERFYRADPHGGHGSGLGLAIVKHLVEAHGGHITVESTVGAGSRFTVWLPALVAGENDATTTRARPPLVSR